MLAASIRAILAAVLFVEIAAGEGAPGGAALAVASPEARGPLACLPESASSPAQVDCLQLAAAYAHFVDEALRCNSKASSPKCVVRIPSGLVCPCPLFANKDRQYALRRLRELSAEFDANGCEAPQDCPACRSPVAASCALSGLCTPTFNR